MSHASKQVEWCLKKADKEIEECKKFNKSLKHRGLLKVGESKEKAIEHLTKAEENLHFSTSLDKSKYGYKVIESLFYCMYQCFLSISARFGYESGNQTCTIALIEYLKEQNKIELDDKFIEIIRYKDEQKNERYISLIDMREDYTYSAKTSIDEEKIKDLTEICQQMLEKTKEIIY